MFTIANMFACMFESVCACVFVLTDFGLNLFINLLYWQFLAGICAHFLTASQPRNKITTTTTKNVNRCGSFQWQAVSKWKISQQSSRQINMSDTHAHTHKLNYIHIHICIYSGVHKYINIPTYSVIPSTELSFSFRFRQIGQFAFQSTEFLL